MKKWWKIVGCFVLGRFLEMLSSLDGNILSNSEVFQRVQYSYVWSISKSHPFQFYSGYWLGRFILHRIIRIYGVCTARQEMKSFVEKRIEWKWSGRKIRENSLGVAPEKWDFSMVFFFFFSWTVGFGAFRSSIVEKRWTFSRLLFFYFFFFLSLWALDAMRTLELREAVARRVSSSCRRNSRLSRLRGI